MTKIITSSIAILLMVGFLTACTNNQMGTVGGGVVGGVAGSALTGGSVGGTIVGAGAGALIGNAVTR